MIPRYDHDLVCQLYNVVVFLAFFSTVSLLNRSDMLCSFLTVTRRG